MKIQRKKTKHIYDPEHDNLSESDETNQQSMHIEELSLDDELWEDWQKIMDTERQLNESLIMEAPEADNTEKEEFGEPVVVKAKSRTVHTPLILHNNFKRKPCKRKNNILRNFICNEMVQQPSRVVICGTIVPDVIRQQRKMKKGRKEKASTSTDDSMNCNDRDDEFENEDSTEMNQTFFVEESTTTPSPTLVERNLAHFYSLRNTVICVMEPTCKLSFHGKLRINVLFGALSVYGATLTRENTESPVEVYSSRDSSLVSIASTCLEDESNNISNVWQSLKSDGIDENVSNDFQKYINNLENGWTVLRLQNIETNLTKFLNAHCTHRLFPKIDDSSNYSWSDQRRAEIILQSNFYCVNSDRQIMDFGSIEETINSILGSQEDYSHLKILFAGGKSVGKSSSMRYTVNKLLQKSESVVLLDLDVGQAEFTPPGCISLNIIKEPLLGPNYTHLRAPYFHLYIGGVDTSKNLTNYIEGVNRLAQILISCKDIAGRPVVINTMGFCKGIGWDIICHAIQIVKPTTVIQISSRRPKNNFDHLLTHQIVSRQVPTWKNWIKKSSPNPGILSHTHHIVDSRAEKTSASGESWNIEPHQLREIVMLSYLSGILKTVNLKEGVKDYTTYMNGIVPYRVPFSSVKLSLGKPLVPQVLSVMNGNIVALCGIESNEEEVEDSETDVGYPRVLIRAPLAVCYGFGILRGVDMENESLYINTPITPAELKYVNCLIGSTPVPSGLLQLNRPGLPYTGGECNLPTSRDARRGYVRIRQRNDNN